MPRMIHCIQCGRKVRINKNNKYYTCSSWKCVSREKKAREETMTKQHIELLLKQNGITRNSKSYQDYEKAKEIIIRGPMDEREYQRRIGIITQYLKI